MALTRLGPNQSINLASNVTGTLPQANIADEAINEAKVQISNAGSNGEFLSKQSGNTGGLTWAAAGENVQPYCYAYMATSRAFDDAVATRIQYDTAIYNVGSCLDVSSTLGRFTPNVAGKYVMLASFKVNNNTIATTKYQTLRFTKNGDTGSGSDYTNHVYAYELD